MSQTPAHKPDTFKNTDTGSAFVSQDEAQSAFEKLRLDPGKWEVMRCKSEGGWLIVTYDRAKQLRMMEPLDEKDEKSVDAKGDSDTEQSDNPNEYVNPNAFYLVQFPERSSSDDTEDVYLGVQGDQITLQRGKTVTIPGYFIHCALGTTYPIFKMIPGEPRKQAGSRCLYPPIILGKSTREAYMKTRREGTRKSKEKYSAL